MDNLWVIYGLSMEYLWAIYGSGWCFFATPPKNMSSSIGMMKFPIYGIIKNVPNHQQAISSSDSNGNFQYDVVIENSNGNVQLTFPLKSCDFP